MLSAVYAECRYADYRYAKWSATQRYYAELSGAVILYFVNGTARTLNSRVS